MNISRVLPQPVRVVLGGNPTHVRQLRMVDVAGLQQWLIEHYPDPWPEYRARMSEVEGRERMKLAVRAYLACENFPICVMGSLSRLLFSTEGLPFLLHDVLGLRVRPEDVTSEEFLTLWWVIWGGSETLDEIAGILDPPQPRGRDDGPIDWGERFMRILAEYPAYTLASLGELYVSQWLLLCGAEGGGRTMSTDPGSKAQQERRELFEEVEAEMEAEKEQSGRS